MGSKYNVTELRALIELLAERFPAAFAVYEAHREPLRVGIYADLLATGAFNAKELGAALGYYTRSLGYQRGLARPHWA